MGFINQLITGGHHPVVFARYLRMGLRAGHAKVVLCEEIRQRKTSGGHQGWRYGETASFRHLLLPVTWIYQLFPVVCVSTQQYSAWSLTTGRSRFTYDVRGLKDWHHFCCQHGWSDEIFNRGPRRKPYWSRWCDKEKPRRKWNRYSAATFFFLWSLPLIQIVQWLHRISMYFIILNIFWILSKKSEIIYIYIAIGSMVLVYMLTWLGYINGIHVTIYSSTMDPSWDMYLYVFVHPVARKSMTSSLDWKFLFLWNTYHISVFSNLVSLDMGDGSKSYYNFHIWGTLWQFNISYWTWP